MTKLIDLSREIYEGTPVYPGDPLFQTRPFAEHGADGFRGSTFTIGSHLGTHIDAPFHYFVDGETLDAFDLDFLSGDALCLDVAPLIGPDSERFLNRPDRHRPAALRVDDIAPYESAIDAANILILRTDWAKKFGDADFYCEFPSLSPELCDWLADFPNLRILGLETPSVVASYPRAEPGGDDESQCPFDKDLIETVAPASRVDSRSTAVDSQQVETPPLDELEMCADAECHRILLGRRPPILILEGLVSLDALPRCVVDGSQKTPVSVDPSRAFKALVAPIPIRGVDGAPARVVAFLQD